MKTEALSLAAFAAAAATILLAGCDLFADPPPFEANIKRPQDSDTLVVGEPFQVKAQLESDYAIKSASVAIYRNFRSLKRDTVFRVPLSVPASARSLRVDTTLTIDSLPGSLRGNFTLLVGIRWRDNGGGWDHADVIIVESGQE